MSLQTLWKKICEVASVCGVWCVDMLGTGFLRKMRAYREQVIALPHINKQWVEEVDEPLRW